MKIRSCSKKWVNSLFGKNSKHASINASVHDWINMRINAGIKSIWRRYTSLRILGRKVFKIIWAHFLTLQTRFSISDKWLRNPIMSLRFESMGKSNLPIISMIFVDLQLQYSFIYFQSLKYPCHKIIKI